MASSCTPLLLIIAGFLFVTSLELFFLEVGFHINKGSIACMLFLLCGTVVQQGKLLSLSSYNGFQGDTSHMSNTRLAWLYFVSLLLASEAELSWLCCSPLLVLQQEVPKVVKSLNKQLREKSVKTKVNFEHSLCPNSCGFVKILLILHLCGQ